MAAEVCRLGRVSEAVLHRLGRGLERALTELELREPRISVREDLFDLRRRLSRVRAPCGHEALHGGRGAGEVVRLLLQVRLVMERAGLGEERHELHVDDALGRVLLALVLSGAAADGEGRSERDCDGRDRADDGPEARHRTPHLANRLSR